MADNLVFLMEKLRSNFNTLYVLLKMVSDSIISMLGKSDFGDDF